MYQIFENAFPADPGRVAESDIVAGIKLLDGTDDFFKRYGGTSFARGLYRVMRATDVAEWNSRVIFAFPDFEARSFPFAYDWLGRVFALDVQRIEDGAPAVLMFEPGTGEVLEIPANLSTFHCRELLESGEAALAVEGHRTWLENGGEEPGYDKCIGYRRPLFLGGVDGMSNFELSDVDVYWHICGQLIRKARGLPAGTPINVR